MATRSFPPIYVLRHGETTWNAEGRMQGRLNSPLTDKGIEQAIRQQHLLASQDLDDFVACSSPQGRAYQTATLAVAGLIDRIETDDRLTEIDVGQFQGRLRSEIAEENPDIFGQQLLGWYDKAPGGEGFAGLEARCRAFLDQVDGPTIVVTHGVTSRFLRSILLSDDISLVSDLPGGQGVVHRVIDGRHDTLD
ncbi:histidine phosphatase family protein [Pseudaestuariivita rosea]|uniref:histidine phosphatase family protein n=1 Tax=Pseudaestuariivita rosea TaxID=2763263 RepID=UPI001ABAEF6C|nr:histidine phosphatase family protein [Pseudaestuariivita rosea]